MNPISVRVSATDGKEFGRTYTEEAWVKIPKLVGRIIFDNMRDNIARRSNTRVQITYKLGIAEFDNGQE